MATLNIKNVPDPLYRKLRAAPSASGGPWLKKSSTFLTQATQEPKPSRSSL
ncbi:MAG: hypothetical protein M5R38_06880 [Candidatus Methylomirabilis sp.]|nr:hypothetical protein [Candidatus Methylomirabilis sp.]